MGSYTLAQECSFEGIGIHSGKPGRCLLLPLETAQGMCVKEGDQIYPLSRLPLESIDYSTVVRLGARVVRTIEHLVAACVFSGIDHVIIQLEGEEIPILDGSSLPIVEKIKEAGKKQIGAKRKVSTVRHPFSLSFGKSSLTLSPSFCNEKEKISLSYFFTHDHYSPSFYSFEGELSKLGEEIAAARTFGHLEQLPLLTSHGLAQGASLDNTLAFQNKKPIVTPRFANEPVRHKVLDLIGDLTLITGFPFVGRIVAHNTGHTFHAACIKLLRQEQAKGIVITH